MLEKVSMMRTEDTRLPTAIPTPFPRVYVANRIVLRKLVRMMARNHADSFIIKIDRAVLLTWC